MLSAITQPSMSNNNDKTTRSRPQSPTRKIPSSGIKIEPRHESFHSSSVTPKEQSNDDAQQRSAAASSSPHILKGNGLESDLEGDRMEYTDEAPLHPLAPARPLVQQQQPSYAISTQPQQHQQLLKLKTEHGLSSPSPSYPSSVSVMGTPDIVMSNDDSEETNGPSSGSSSNRRVSSDVNMASTEGSNNNKSSSDAPAMAMATTGTAAPTSRRPSLRTMTATLPRSALQEETIALFKQYRNLIPCAKCFSRNTIQRDGMSDGNLRFKCRPPVSKSLICNKSYSESKIRNMIAGVVYGHSLPDPTNSSSSTNDSGENVLALAPPPMVKTSTSRRGSKMGSSPRISSEVTPEKLQQRLQQQQQQQQQEGEEGTPVVATSTHDQSHDDHELYKDTHHHHTTESRRHSQSLHPSQSNPSRRGSVQHLARRPSMTGDESMMMDYDEQATQQAHAPNHTGHFQVPSTPPMDGGDEPRFQRSRSGYGRAITPTGPGGPSLPQQQASTFSTAASSSGGRQIHKLHHSHSHPNIGQQRYQHYLEQQQQEMQQREHRGSISGSAYPNHSTSQLSQSHQQRSAPYQLVRRDSSQYLGSTEHRSSQPSPVMGSKYIGESLSPAPSSSPRSSPDRETPYSHSLQQHNSAQSHDSAVPSSRNVPHAGNSRFDDSTNGGYFQRRMSHPHSSHVYSSNGHAGLPPPLPSPLSHPYDRRASEVEEYPQMHREKYERLNANTMLAPSSATAPSRLPQQPKNRSQYPPGSPGGDSMHPLDVSTNHQAADDLNTSQQALTPPMKPIQHHFSSGGHGVASASSAASPPWIGPGNIHGAQNGMQTPQSEPMRYSHSLPMSGSRPPPRHLYPSSSLYYQTPRQDDRDRFDSENDRDPSPDYHDVDSDGRPIARMRSHGLKRKSLGQPLSRSNSNQNLYSTSLQQYQNQYSSNSHSQHHYNSSHRSSSQNHLDQSQYQQHHDLNAAMPQSSIKLSCFPGRDNSNITSNPIPITRTLDTTEAMAMHLNESSKLVIEIHQPRSPQSYMQMASNGSSSNRASHSAIIQRSNSQPNIMLARSSSSILGQRRSPSLDRSSCEGSSTKKRRADSDSVPSGGSSAGHSDVDSIGTKAAVASASATATESFYTITSQGHGSGAQKPQNEASTAIQVFGVDYLANNDEDATMKDGQVHAEIGLGLSTMATSPTVEALRVAKGSSYALVEDQKKEMGIDYSMFTRVETAGWRILIPPNVVASFRSDEFGLMLKPKGIEEVEFAIGAEDQVQEQGSRHKHGHGPAMTEHNGNTKALRQNEGAFRTGEQKSRHQQQHRSTIQVEEEDEEVEEACEEEEEAGEVEEEPEEEKAKEGMEEDVNVEGVRRIALQDDDRDEHLNQERSVMQKDEEMHGDIGSAPFNKPAVSSVQVRRKGMGQEEEQDELEDDDH